MHFIIKLNPFYSAAGEYSRHPVAADPLRHLFRRLGEVQAHNWALGKQGGCPRLGVEDAVRSQRVGGVAGRSTYLDLKMIAYLGDDSLCPKMIA
jgi:hypothetical protein